MVVKSSILRIINKTDYDLEMTASANKGMGWAPESSIPSGSTSTVSIAFNEGAANGYAEYSLENGLFRILANSSYGPRMSVVNESVASTSLKPSETKDIPWKEGSTMTLTIGVGSDGSANYTFTVDGENATSDNGGTGGGQPGTAPSDNNGTGGTNDGNTGTTPPDNNSTGGATDGQPGTTPSDNSGTGGTTDGNTGTTPSDNNGAGGATGGNTSSDPTPSVPKALKSSNLRIVNNTSYAVEKTSSDNTGMSWVPAALIASGATSTVPVAFNKGGANGYVEYRIQNGLFRILADFSHGPRMSLLTQSVPSSSLKPTQSTAIPWKEGATMTVTIRDSTNGAANYSFSVAG